MPNQILPDASPDSPFNAMAAAYERWADPASAAAVDILLDRLSVGDGMRILDVGAGLGNFAVPASRAGAAVVAVDNAPAMVARLRERLAPYPNSDAQLRNLYNLPIDGQDYDAVVSLFCAAFFPDAQKIFARLTRMTKPGGKVAIVNWANTTGGPMFEILARALRALPVADDAQTTPPSLRQLLDPAELRTALEQAGLQVVDAWTIDLLCPMPGADTFLDELDTFFQIIPAYTALSAADKAKLQPLIEAEFAKTTWPNSNYALQVPANIAIGTAPVQRDGQGLT